MTCGLTVEEHRNRLVSGPETRLTVNNWDALIRLIVPLSVMTIWALLSLFNREGAAKPVQRTPSLPPRPGSLEGLRTSEPTLRWNSSTSGEAATSTNRTLPPRRAAARSNDDGIVILSSDNARSVRDSGGRGTGSLSSKRPSKGKSVVPQRQPEPVTSRARLAGVSQNVNQHLTNTNLELTPLKAMPAATAMPSLGLSSAPSVAPETIGVSPRSAAAMAIADPKRLREAFLLNEILLPPVSMRDRRIGPTPMG